MAAFSLFSLCKFCAVIIVVYSVIIACYCDGLEMNDGTISAVKWEREKVIDNDAKARPKLEEFKGWPNSDLVDEPIQLVSPDPVHKRLVLNEENIKRLHAIKGAVATIAVVGKFHSGKSFLLNQLMGKASGFGVGPTVRPKTMGIWMWGKPTVITLPSKQKVSVIYLDTEGFAANNVTENYDAKIFAVATLLSSYLLYNSVKIIDQADIDYLELLARRTQLFALRSQLSKSSWTDHFNHDLLSFPPLVWVVQDFVQTTDDDQTPQEWLHKLMDSHLRESDAYDISLLGIFKSVDCHTLFLPAVSKKHLMDLSKVTEVELTADYRVERDQLISKIHHNLKPKEKNNRPITGPEMAALLEILVTAANEGSLADVPSRWDGFIKRIKDTATEDCLKFYDGEIEKRKATDQPIKSANLYDFHKQSTDTANKLLDHLLFGMGDAIPEARTTLNNGIAERFRRMNDLNDKKLKLKCIEIQHRKELEVETLLSDYEIPQGTAVMERKLALTANDAILNFVVQLAEYIEEDSIETYRNSLATSLRGLSDSILHKNKKAMEDKLSLAVQSIIKLFREMTANTANKVRPPKDLTHLIAETSDIAGSKFKANSDFAKGESIYEPFSAMFKAQMEEAIKDLHLENQKFLETDIRLYVIELSAKYRESTLPQKLNFPLNETDLENRLQIEFRRSFESFETTFDDYSEYQAYRNGIDLLRRSINEIMVFRKDENLAAFEREVIAPLTLGKQVAVLSADLYTTHFALHHYLRTVCEMQLSEGKARFWSQRLRDDIVTHFIENDADLQRLLNSRKGVWSSFFGFFQWLLWLFNLEG